MVLIIAIDFLKGHTLVFDAHGRPVLKLPNGACASKMTNYVSEIGQWPVHEHVRALSKLYSGFAVPCVCHDTNMLHRL